MMDQPFCNNCGGRIETMTFRGTRWCSDDCRKGLEERRLQLAHMPNEAKTEAESREWWALVEAGY